MLKLKSLTKYGPKLSKVSVLNRGLLTTEDYLELIAKSSVGEVASYLKNQTAYAVVFDGSNEALMHREELEERLSDGYAVDFEKIYQAADPSNKAFLSYVFIRSEVETLKNILRRIENGREDIAVHVPVFYRKHYTIDVEKLSKAKTVREFLERLAGSRYETQIRPHLTMEEHQNIFSVEFALDTYYHAQIKRLSEKLADKTDKKVVRAIVGAETDALNLMWIYRLKNYFKTDNDLIYTYLLPNDYRLKRRDIVALVQSKSVAEFLAMAQKTPYGSLFSGDISVHLTHRYQWFDLRLHKRMQRENPFTLATEICYLHRKEQEIKNITSIAEGIRYGLPTEKIVPYVIGVFEETEQGGKTFGG